MTNRGLFKGTGTGHLKLDNKRIRGVADPVDPQDVATRGFFRGATSQPPSTLPATASSRWDPLVSMYNWRQSDLHAVRAALKKLATSVAPMHVFFLGDSTLVGYNGSTYNSDRAIPRQFGLALSYMLGGIPYTDGARQAIAAGSSAANDRWTLTGGFSTNIANSHPYLTGSGAGTAKWASIDRGTSIDLIYSDLSTTGATYSVDGAAPVTITTAGTSTLKKVTVSGLADTPHNVLVTQTTGTFYIAATRVYSPGLVQLHVHNLGVGGSKANSGGVAGANWSDTTAPGLQTEATLMMAAGCLNITPDLVVVCCGNNDVTTAGGIDGPATVAGLTNMRNIWPTAPVIFIHPPKVPGTNDVIFDDFTSRIYTMCDTLGTAYFSWDDWDNRTASYIADGLAGADNIHPTDAEAMSVARHLATQLAGPETYSNPMTAQSLIADVVTSGTTEQIIFQTPIPSWFWKAGTTLKMFAAGVVTGTTPTIAATCRVGAAGTTADTAVTSTAASAAIASGAGWQVEAQFTCRTAGASGTVMGRMTFLADGVAVKMSTTTAAVTVDTTHAGYFTFTVTPGGTTPVVTSKISYFDSPPGP